VLNLVNGIASLTVALPTGCVEGAVLSYSCEVTDASRTEPFLNRFRLKVRGKATSDGGGNGRRKPPGSAKGDKRDAPTLLAMPNVTRITEESWEKQEPSFDKYTALRIKHAGSQEDDGKEKHLYDFFVNADNLYLKAEQKRTKLDTSAKATIACSAVGRRAMEPPSLSMGRPRPLSSPTAANASAAGKSSRSRARSVTSWRLFGRRRFMGAGKRRLDE